MKTSIVLAMILAPLVGVGAQEVSYPSPERQIAAAVSPMPEHLRAGAKVLGYDAQGKLVTLRSGRNEMTCIADDPRAPRFHVACYHNTLEPFMARGRELAPRKLSREAVDSIRLADIRAGRWTMPTRPAGLYQYFAARDSVDAATGVVKGAQYLYVVYTPYATYQTTGISENPVDGGPWLMFPGKPWAHLMIAPQKPATVTPK